MHDVYKIEYYSLKSCLLLICWLLTDIIYALSIETVVRAFKKYVVCHVVHNYRHILINSTI